MPHRHHALQWPPGAGEASQNRRASPRCAARALFKRDAQSVVARSRSARYSSANWRYATVGQSRNRVGDLVKTISQTPLPTILVGSGILFWLLAIAGSVAGQITIEPGMRRTAQVVGSALIAFGLVLFLVPIHTDQPAAEATVKPTPTPTSIVPAPGPSAPTPTPTMAFPTPSPPTPPTPTGASHARPSPGVNCTASGTPDEIAICSNARLADLDWQLHDLYLATLNSLDQTQQAKLAHEEGLWVRQRGLCRSDTNCLVEAYNLRISQLKSSR